MANLRMIVQIMPRVIFALPSTISGRGQGERGQAGGREKGSTAAASSHKATIHEPSMHRQSLWVASGSAPQKKSAPTARHRVQCSVNATYSFLGKGKFLVLRLRRPVWPLRLPPAGPR